MDNVQGILLLTPDPSLLRNFTALKFIYRAVQKLQSSEEQFRALVYSVAELLQALDSEYLANRLPNDDTAELLGALLKSVDFLLCNHYIDFDLFYRLMHQILSFLKKEADRDFLASIFAKDDRITQIEDYHRKICTLTNTFKVYPGI
jgi:hypothetical protein